MHRNVLRASAISNKSFQTTENNKSTKKIYRLILSVILLQNLKLLHIIRTLDGDHKKVFPEIPTMYLKNHKNLLEHLARDLLLNEGKVGSSEPYGAEISFSTLQKYR